MDPHIAANMAYAWTALDIATDVIFTILPWLIIRNLQMSKRKKSSVMCILGIGALGAVASFIRLPYLDYFHHLEKQGSLREYLPQRLEYVAGD